MDEAVAASGRASKSTGTPAKKSAFRFLRSRSNSRSDSPAATSAGTAPSAATTYAGSQSFSDCGPEEAHGQQQQQQNHHHHREGSGEHSEGHYVVEPESHDYYDDDEGQDDDASSVVSSNADGGPDADALMRSRTTPSRQSWGGEVDAAGHALFTKSLSHVSRGSPAAIAAGSAGHSKRTLSRGKRMQQQEGGGGGGVGGGSSGSLHHLVSPLLRSPVRAHPQSPPFAPPPTLGRSPSTGSNDAGAAATSTGDHDYKQLHAHAIAAAQAASSGPSSSATGASAANAPRVPAARSGGVDASKGWRGRASGGGSATRNSHVRGSSWGGTFDFLSGGVAKSPPDPLVPTGGSSRLFPQKKSPEAEEEGGAAAARGRDGSTSGRHHPKLRAAIHRRLNSTDNPSCSAPGSSSFPIEKRPALPQKLLSKSVSFNDEVDIVTSAANAAVIAVDSAAATAAAAAAEEAAAAAVAAGKANNADAGTAAAAAAVSSGAADDGLDMSRLLSELNRLREEALQKRSQAPPGQGFGSFLEKDKAKCAGSKALLDDLASSDQDGKEGEDLHGDRHRGPGDSHEDAQSPTGSSSSSSSVDSSEFLRKVAERAASRTASVNARMVSAKMAENLSTEQLTPEHSNMLDIVHGSSGNSATFSSGGGNHHNSSGGGSAAPQENLDCRRFTLAQLQEATDDFADRNLLGRGAYGPVYRGLLFGCQVAIKKLEAGSEQGPAEFRMEVEVLSRIRHPHIVLLMGHCPEESSIVYEFLPGGNLQERIVRAGDNPPPALQWHDRLRIISEIAGALLYMHRNDPPILHRDLKPDNILLDANQISKIADVGLARLIPEEVSAVTWKVRGTAGYIDPEEIQTGELSTKSDIYAFGLIVLQLLTGLKNVKQLHRLLQECGTGARDVDKATEILEEHLDESAGRWPMRLVSQAIGVAVRCIERKRSLRPDLSKEIYPKLLALAEDAAAEKDRRAREKDSRFICPLSKKRMRDPVVAGDGHTYERAAIEKWLLSSDLSPVTGMALPHKSLTPNFILASLMDSM